MLASLPWTDKADEAGASAWVFRGERGTPGSAIGEGLVLSDGRRVDGDRVSVATACSELASVHEAIIVIAAAADASVPFDVRQGIERWAGEGGGAGEPVVDLSLRARVIWTRDRIAVFGTPEQIDEAVPAAVALSVLFSAAKRLDEGIAAIWPSIAGDAALTRSVKPADLRRQAHVDGMTERGWRLRAEHVALTRLVERPATLSPAGLRLYRELALQVGLADRLSSMEEAVECIQDLYESANDRLSEFRYFRTEFVVEMLILAVLVAELVLLGLELVS
jgi:hypothetical protein